MVTFAVRTKHGWADVIGLIRFSDLDPDDIRME
jgi:hypothetical protein